MIWEWFDFGRCSVTSHLFGLLCCCPLACARQDVRDILRHIHCLKNEVPRLLSLVLRSRILTTSGTGFSRFSYFSMLVSSLPIRHPTASCFQHWKTFLLAHLSKPDVRRHGSVLILALQRHLSGLLCCSPLACARQDVRDILRHIRCLKMKCHGCCHWYCAAEY